MKKKMKYRMGDHVLVMAVQEKVHGPSAYSYRWQGKLNLHPERIGIVCGLCRRYSGTIRESASSYMEPEDCGPRWLDVAERHTFYEVRFGWLNRPVLVAEEDMRLAPPEAYEGREFPVQASQQPAWKDSDRKYLRDIMKERPRDKQGRWVKEKL